MNDIIGRQGSLANVSLDQAQYLLKNLGVLAGAQTEILTKRIEDLQAAAEKAKEVADKMADEASDLQDQIDEINGNNESIEDRRHQQKLDDLKSEAEADGQLNTAAYKHLIDLENQLHALKLKNIADQQAQAATSNTTASTASSSSGTSGGLGGGGNVTFNVDLSSAIVMGGNKQDLQEALARVVLPGLQAIKAKSTGNILGGR